MKKDSKITLQGSQIYNESEIQKDLADVESKLEIIEKQLQPQTTLERLADWLRFNKYQVVFSIISTVGFMFYTIQQNARQTILEQNIIELRQRADHDKETDFALRLSGLKQTAVTTEDAMRDYYQQNLELIEVTKQLPCQIPIKYRNVKPLPNYVPAAAIYLEEKQKLLQKGQN